MSYGSNPVATLGANPVNKQTALATATDRLEKSVGRLFDDATRLCNLADRLFGSQPAGVDNENNPPASCQMARLDSIVAAAERAAGLIQEHIGRLEQL